jgi:hypothetical protein
MTVISDNAYLNLLREGLAMRDSQVPEAPSVAALIEMSRDMRCDTTGARCRGRFGAVAGEWAWLPCGIGADRRWVCASCTTYRALNSEPSR